MNLLDRYILFLEKYHRLVVLVILLATAVFGYLLKDIRFANAFEGWVQQDHPAIQEYRKFLTQFNSFEIVALAMEADGGVFTPEALRRLANVDNKIRERAEKVRVVDFFYTAMLQRGAGGIEYDTPVHIVPEITEEGVEIPPEKAEAFRRVATDNRLVRDNFVSKDEKSVMSAILFVDGGPNYRFIPESLDIMRKAMAEEEAPGIKFHLAGGLVLNREMNRLTKQQALLFAPLVFMLAVLLLALLLRSARDVFLVTLCTACSLVWAVGLYVGTGHPVNFLMVAMPPLVLVISVADAVHIIMRYREGIANGTPPRFAVAEAMRACFPPCLFTSLTTAAGFGVLVSSEIPVIRTFGQYSAAGIMMAFTVAMTLIPAMLMEDARMKRRAAAPPPTGMGTFAPMLEFAWMAARRRPRIILLLGVAVFGASLHGISRIVTDTNNLEFFRKDNPVRRDMEFVEDNLVGLSSMEFMYRVEAGRDLMDPEILRAMYELEKFLKQQPEVTNTMSMADYVVEVNRWLTGRADEFPSSAALVRAMLKDSRFAAVGERHQYMTKQGTIARVSARVKYSSTHELRALVDRVNAYLRDHMIEGCSVSLTGGAPVYLSVADGVLNGQVRSFVLVLLIVSAMTMVLFRSVQWGLLAVAPSVVPILFVMGVMGWAGIPLNLATMMIASISIGIAVDDTMHYAVRVRRELAAGSTHADAVRITLSTTGHPIITTTLVLMAGFGALIFSSFVPISEFGLLSALTMIFALLGDLFVFSALVVYFRPKV